MAMTPPQYHHERSDALAKMSVRGNVAVVAPKRWGAFEDNNANAGDNAKKQDNAGDFSGNGVSFRNYLVCLSLNPERCPLFPRQ